MSPSNRSGTPGRQARLRAIVKPWLRQITLLAVGSLLGGLVEAVILLLITQGAFTIAQGTVDSLEVLGRSLSIGALAGFGLCLIALRLVLGMVTAGQASYLGAAAVARTRGDLAAAYLAADWGVVHGQRSGRLQELLTSFAGRTGELMFQVARVTFASCALLALLVVAVVVDAAASVAAMAVAVLLILVLRPLRRAVRGRAQELAIDQLELATALAEVDALDLEARVFGVRRSMSNRLGELIDRVARRQRRLGFRQELAIPASSSLLYTAMFVALAVVSASGEAHLASVGAVMLILLRAFGYAQLLQNATVGLNSTLPFVGELDAELDRLEAARPRVGEVAVDTVENITLAGVGFEYEPGVPVLRDISASLGPNEVVGIVGASGVGKSTLVLLMLGVLSPTSGAVLVGDRNLAELSQDDWSRLVSFVPQRPRLMAGTIAENIRFMRGQVTDEDVERAARLAHLHDEVMARADGYQGRVGERGEALSIGQQQRLTIARALAARPQVLVLDEPTSALDSRNEELVRAALRDLKQTMTIIIVAHRRSTLDICDRIMVLEGGLMGSFASPEELRRNSVYFREVVERSGLE